MYQKIIQLLEIHGYQQVSTKAGPCYTKKLNGKTKGIFVIYDENPDGSLVSEEDLKSLVKEGKESLGFYVPILIIVLSEHGNHAFLDPENQFSELYKPVSAMLYAMREEKAEKKEKISFGSFKVTILLTIINILLFLLCEWNGEKIYALWGCRSDLVLKEQQFYRLLTSNYLHYGLDHIANNMIVFVLLGSRLEKIMGSIRYLILYTASGIFGSLVSVLYYGMLGDYTMSVGASGAIFGICGALAAIFLCKRKQLNDFDGPWIFIMIAGSLYHGFQSSGTDNAAHIGGCVAGFILAFVLYVLWPEKQE